MIDQTERKAQLSAGIQTEYAASKERIEKLCGTAVLLHANGTWKLIAADESPIARFNLVPFPNCGAVAVLCDLYIEPPYRMVGLARLLQNLRIRAAQRAGVQVLLATVVTSSKSAMQLFGEGWAEVLRLNNPETGNEVVLLTLNVLDVVRLDR